ncbi:MAG: DUF4124 domain-containing protein [Smithellaceae bacterium]
MKKILLLLCVFSFISTAAYAQELFKCTDADGNMIFTSAPQDGMKCAGTEGTDDEPKRSSVSDAANIIDKCSHFSRELEDVNDEINTLEKCRSELQREQLKDGQSDPADHWNYRRRSGRTPPVNEKMRKLSNEISTLSRKRTIINQDIRLYKCHEINNDLSKINQKKPDRSTGGRYR